MIPTTKLLSFEVKTGYVEWARPHKYFCKMNIENTNSQTYHQAQSLPCTDPGLGHTPVLLKLLLSTGLRMHLPSRSSWSARLALCNILVRTVNKILTNLGLSGDECVNVGEISPLELSKHSPRPQLDARHLPSSSSIRPGISNYQSFKHG